MNKSLLSSKRHDWETPQALFDELDREFHFTLGPCATIETAKCEKFFTAKENGLAQNWGAKRCFVTRLMGESFQNGLRNAQRKASTQKLLCSSLHGRTQERFMNTFMAKLKSDFLKDGLNSELTAKSTDPHRFRQCSCFFRRGE